MEISDQKLLEVIQNAPLVSIDVIVKNKAGKILLGLRTNEPAKDTWFVPGGRIRKDEDLDLAFKRIAADELGLDCARDQARFIGIFEHKYETNFLNVPGVGTYYIVLAYEIRPRRFPQNFPSSQHQQYRWFTPSEAITDAGVHENVRLYFENQILTDTQYAALNARRDSFNHLVWRTPVLSLTAQAFLFTIALNPGVSTTARTLSASLALITALASAQLLVKHRFSERKHAHTLENFERKQGLDPINQRPTTNLSWNPITWMEGLPSFWIWLGMLIVFALFALFILLFPAQFVGILPIS